MINNIRKYKIGYVDEESQWVDKFKLRLKDSFVIQSFPLAAETTLDELVIKVEEADLDCLIVDFELKEADIVQFNGDEIIEVLRKKYPLFPVFIITAKEEEDVLSQVDDNEIVRLKEELDLRPNILIQRITNKIESYQKEIYEAENTIRQLTEIKNGNNQLTAAQEELLFEKYLFLEKIFPNEKMLPDSLAVPESVHKLTEIVEQTRMILEELKKQNKDA